MAAQSSLPALLLLPALAQLSEPAPALSRPPIGPGGHSDSSQPIGEEDRHARKYQEGE